MRLELINNRDRRSAAVVINHEPVTAAEVHTAACNKFRLNPKHCHLVWRGRQLQPTELLTNGASVWVVHGKEPYGGPCEAQAHAEQSCKDCVSVIEGDDVYIDPEAVKQVHQTVLHAGGSIVKAVCMPDLHSGPTGVAILARNPMPKLPGYDIGCGMALFRTRIPATISKDRVARSMARLNLDAGEDPADPQLGTIGGGNHFAELLVIDHNVPLSRNVHARLDPDYAVLLVHSGSRAHGQRVFAEHNDGHDLEGYMRKHEELVGWARRNRAEIARRFLQQFAGARSEDELHVGADERVAEARQHNSEQPSQQGGGATQRAEHGAASSANVGDGCQEPSRSATGDGQSCLQGGFADLTPVVDIAHNWIERLPDGTFLHRKGAAPSHTGQLSLLPGSRATASYVLVCSGSHSRDLNSVAHGAGRRLSRADARRRWEGGKVSDDLTRGGTVVCEVKDLLLEEAPHAYKDVEAVVSCMVQHGMCSIGARMLPIATYKTRAANTGAAGH